MVNESSGKLILRVTLGTPFLKYGAYIGEVLAIDPKSGGLKLEAQYLYFFTAVAVALLGPGRYAFNQR
jgi:hypothetical protein